DFHVTGVQTCALPILKRGAGLLSLLPRCGTWWPRQLSARSLLFEHPNVLMGHPQPGVRPVSHAGTLDLHPLNELQPPTLQLLSVPLGHPHDLAAANVVFDVDDKHTSASEHPDALGPNAPVRLPVRFTPLHLPRIGRME